MPTHQYIDVADGVSLHAIVHHGDRTPFVLVHGLASNARLWDGVADQLAARGHAVIALDQRGHGLSSKPDSGYETDVVAGDLASVITTLGLRAPVVVGQSWGGNVVIELAARWPQLVKGVAAVDGGFIELHQRFDTWDSCRAALTPPRLIGTPRHEMEQRMRAFHPHWPEQGILGALANFEVRDDGTIAPWLTLDRHLLILRALYEHRPSQLFPVLEVPVLLVPADTGDVAWTHDKRTAVDEAMRHLRNGTAHWFSPADHDIHAQFPTELAEVLASWEDRLQ